ncbi:hypothetical protein ACSYAD_04915 [Acaryochloris marina NIES-2412]|uniref:hypothetical protein n=1 Tax=Acaryochloris marina TaxID=155978 RepID=UPI004057E284
MPELWEWIAVVLRVRSQSSYLYPHGSHDPNEQCLGLSNLGYANSTVRDVTI